MQLPPTLRAVGSASSAGAALGRSPNLERIFFRLYRFGIWTGEIDCTALPVDETET